MALNGHGRATIVGCAEGPTLSSGLRAGFILPGARDGASAASGSSIEGFVFDGRGIADDNLAPLAVAIIGTFASEIRIERNLILGDHPGHHQHRRRSLADRGKPDPGADAVRLHRRAVRGG